MLFCIQIRNREQHIVSGSQFTEWHVVRRSICVEWPGNYNHTFFNFKLILQQQIIENIISTTCCHNIIFIPPQDENENEDTEEELVLTNSGAVALETEDSLPGGTASSGRRHTFFQRSDSTLCLGCPPPDPFASKYIVSYDSCKAIFVKYHLIFFLYEFSDISVWQIFVIISLFAGSIHEALPLADQPQLLQPGARREELFGIPRQPITVPLSGSGPPGLNNPLEGEYTS